MRLRGLIIILKTVILLFAAAVFIWMIIFPQTEGRATNLNLISIYKDPVIIYSYIASIPFFVALYQAFKLLGLVEKNKLSSQDALNTIRRIKYCVLAQIGFIIGGVALLVLYVQGEDIAGPIALGIYISIFFSMIAIAVVFTEKRLKKATTGQKK